MSKILTTFLVAITFISGISIGMYYGAMSNEVEKVEKNARRNSIQDTVIKNVQDETIKIKEEEKDAKEAFSQTTKVSPYAKMTIEKKFSKCGHTTVNVIDVPKELVNLTKEEIGEKYSGWDIKEFSSDGFTLYRVIEANCDDHYVLKEEEGYLTVYADVTENIKNFVEKTNILVETLREEDKIDLEEGIKIYGRGELSSLIEDFSS